MTGYRWTPRRDAQLRADRADGFTFAECARMLGGGCRESEARLRMRELVARPRTQGCVEVPRPVAPPPRAGLIDLSTARSAMEERAAQWNAGRQT